MINSIKNNDLLKNTSGRKQRILSFDFAKGLLMFLVVYGHAIHELMYEESLFDQGIVFLIYSFHMPMFIFISGCFAWKKCHGKLTDMIKVNIQRLLVPGLLVSIVCYFIYHLGEPLITGYYNSTRNVWFVFGLFVIFLVCNLAYKTKFPLELIALFIVLYYATYNWQPIDFLKHFKVAVFLPYFVVGLYFKHFPPPLKFVYFVAGINVMLLIALVIYAPNYCYMTFFKSNQWWFSYSVYPIGFCAAFVFFLLIHKHLRSNNIVEMVCKFGRSTLGVYFIHPFIISFINSVFGKMNSMNIIIVALIVSAISYYIVIFLRKYRLIKSLLLGEYM